MNNQESFKIIKEITINQKLNKQNNILNFCNNCGTHIPYKQYQKQTRFCSEYCKLTYELKKERGVA